MTQDCKISDLVRSYTLSDIYRNGWEGAKESLQVEQQSKLADILLSRIPKEFLAELIGLIERDEHHNSKTNIAHDFRKINKDSVLTLVASQSGGAHQAQNLITKIYENMGKNSAMKKRKRYVMATKAQLGEHRQQKSFDSPLNQLSKTINLIHEQQARQEEINRTYKMEAKNSELIKKETEHRFPQKIVIQPIVNNPSAEITSLDSNASTQVKTETFDQPELEIALSPKRQRIEDDAEHQLNLDSISNSK